MFESLLQEILDKDQNHLQLHICSNPDWRAELTGGTAAQWILIRESTQRQRTGFFSYFIATEGRHNLL